MSDDAKGRLGHNVRHWAALFQTDPRHTKIVKEGGRTYTAVDAYWKIQRATEHFGPCGQGWGWSKPEFSVVTAADTQILVCQLELWWVEPGEPFGAARRFIPAVAACPLASIVKRGTPQEYVKVDDDAWKKAETDAVTKGLTRLGIAGDVFLGFFDGNKYVERSQHDDRDMKPDSVPARAQGTKPNNPVAHVNSQERGQARARGKGEPSWS